MPYIKTSERPYFNKALKQIKEIKTKGQLEYCLMYLLLRYMEGKEWGYSELHNTAYAAHHVGDEFRRLYLDKREDKAMEKNGDIILDEDEDEEA